MTDSANTADGAGSRQAGGFVTAADLERFAPGAVVRMASGARLTPLAADIVAERGLLLVSAGGGPVAVGCDHGGYELKLLVVEHLRSLGREVVDLGTHSTDTVDYPDFASAVARVVASGGAAVGVVVDAAGIGSAMTANKVPGARAAACYTEALARNAREHNGANVLSLGSKTVDADLMRRIVTAFLETELTEERHARRVAKITAVEQRHAR